MKERIKTYVDSIFFDAPQNRDTEDVKEEMLTNLYEKYDDCIEGGKTPADAYRSVVSGIGDMSELIETLKEKERKYSARAKESAKAKSTEEESKKEQYEAVIIDTDKKKKHSKEYSPRKALKKSIKAAYWLIVVAYYFIVSIQTGKWGVTWITFIAAGIFDDLIDLCFAQTLTRARKAVTGMWWCFVVTSYFVVSFITHRWGITWIVFLVGVAVENAIKALFSLKEEK